MRQYSRTGILYGLTVLLGTGFPSIGFKTYAVLVPAPTDLAASSWEPRAEPKEPWYAMFFDAPSKAEGPFQPIPRWAYFEPWLYLVVMPYWALGGALLGAGIIGWVLLTRGLTPQTGSAAGIGKIKARHYLVASVLFVSLLAAPWIITACILPVLPG